MTNREFLQKSVTDLTASEKAEAAIMAKNLLEIIMRNCTEEEKQEILNGAGVYNIPARLKR